MGWVNPDVSPSERQELAKSLGALMEASDRDGELHDHLFRCRGMGWDTKKEPGVYRCYCGAVIRVAQGGVQ